MSADIPADDGDRFTEVKTSLGQLLKLEYEFTMPGLTEEERAAKIEMALGMLIGYAAAEMLEIDVTDHQTGHEKPVRLSAYIRDLKRAVKKPDLLFTAAHQEVNIEMSSDGHALNHTADKMSGDQVALVSARAENQAWHKYKNALLDVYFEAKDEILARRPDAIPWRRHINDTTENYGEFRARMGLND